MSGRLAVPLFGLDYTSEIPVHVLQAAGVKFVYRYTSRYTWKVLTAGEKARLDAAGIGLCVVFEDYANNAVKGYDKGMQDAEFALKWARSMGMPNGRPMPWAVDDGDIRPEQCVAYAEAWGNVWTPRCTGPYGSYSVCHYFADKGFGDEFQTYAWSNHMLDPRAKVHQYSNGHYIHGFEVDYDHAYYPDYGQWNYKAPPPPTLHHYERFPTNVKIKGKLINERQTVMQIDGALVHPVKYRNYLKGALRPRAKSLRDRVWTIAHWYHPAWPKDKRYLSWRWRELNNRMKAIDKIK